MAETTPIEQGETAGRAWLGLVRLVLALGAGGVFVYAGAIKIWDPLRFASDITNYQMVSWPVALRLAFYLPWLELFCGLALIFHRLFAGAVLVTSGLMVMFIGATLLAKAQGVDVTCGCFGSGGSLNFTWHLLLDLALLGALAVLWIGRRQSVRLPA